MSKTKGSITIYLSIVLVSVVVLISVVTEKSRMAVVQSKCKAVTYMATDSVMAGYGKQILDDYGILLVWEDKEVEDNLCEYIQANINLAGLKGQGSNLMATELVQIEKCDVGYITQQGGALFAQQVNSYVRYSGSLKMAEKLIKKFNNYSEGNETKEMEEENAIEIVDTNSDELQNIVRDIEDIILDIKNIDQLEKQFQSMKSEQKNTKNLEKKYKRILYILEEKEKTADEVEYLINEYESKKKILLRTYGYDTNSNDYITKNLDRIEKLRDKINEIRELDVSNASKDSDELTDRVINKTSEIIELLKELKVAEVTEKDEENKSLYESAMDLINKGTVALVIEDLTSISQNAIVGKNLPSDNKGKSKTEENIQNKANFIIYGNMKYGNFFNPKDNTALKYELEYLLNGKLNDSDNLAETIRKLVLVRNGINLAVLLSDNEKISMISSVATSAATAIGLPFMEIAIKAALIEAWALAESVYEVKALMKGWKLELVKTKEKWNVELENLFKVPVEEKHKKGLDYVTYCNLLLLMQSTETIAYRSMDLIQENVQKKYNSDFLMERCFTKIDVKARYETQPIFVAMPWMIGLSNGSRGGYAFSIESNDSY